MKGTLTGRGVLIWLLGFFGVIFAMNAYFITVSARSFRGEDEQKPYLQGVEYNDTLARRLRQQGLGWQATVSAQREPGDVVAVLVRIENRDHAVQPGVNLIGELRHPADENRDHTLEFREVAPGLYRAQIRDVASGRWDVLLHARGENPFDADRRLWLR